MIRRNCLVVRQGCCQLVAHKLTPPYTACSGGTPSFGIQPFPLMHWDPAGHSFMDTFSGLVMRPYFRSRLARL